MKRINASLQRCREIVGAYADGYRVSRDFESGRLTLEQARQALTRTSNQSNAKPVPQVRELRVLARELVARHAS